MKKLKNLIRQVLLSRDHLVTATICIALGVGTSMIIINSITEYLRPISPESKGSRILCMNRMMSFNKDNDGRTFSSISLKFIKEYLSTTKTQEAYSAFTRMSIPRLNGASTETFQVIGCDSQYWNIFDFKMISGRPFTAEEFVNKAPVVVISKSLEQKLTEKERAENRIFFKGKDLKIIGVVENSSSYQIYTNASIWLPYTLLDRREFPGEECGFYEMVYLLKSPSDRPLLVNEVDAIIKRYNSVAANKHILKTLMPRTKLDVLIDGYNTENPNVKRDFYIQWLTIILAILLIPIINLNILNYQHIKDKSIEMAAMRSFGATKYNIASYFLMLNSIVVFFGCAVGYLLSFLFLKVYRIAVFDVERYSSTLIVGGGSPNVYSFAILMLVVLVLTMLTGLFPAIRLSRMNIAQSLKGGSL